MIVISCLITSSDYKSCINNAEFEIGFQTGH